MRSSYIPLASLAPALYLLVAGAAPAQVQVSDHILQVGSLAPQFKPHRDSAPPRQFTYKNSVFVIGETEDLNDYRYPDPTHPHFGSKLRGQQGLGRAFLLTTCSENCDHKDYPATRSVFIDESPLNSSTGAWKQAITVDRFGLTLLPSMFENPDLEFSINGSLVHGTGDEVHIGNSGISHYFIQIFEKTNLCRRYKQIYKDGSVRDDDEGDFVSIDIPVARELPQTANGIVVGAPKVYDTHALLALRNTTLSQMQAINPFVAATITGSYGTLQGVTRDASYLNVQGQFAPPGAAAVSAVTNQTATCPAGYYPAGPSACSPISDSTTALPLTTSATSQTITPATTLSPAIPAPPAAAPLSAPANVGQSGTDALVEQVQLSAQLQMYQLLLQGAQSDTLFLQNSRAVANRAQTTIGFPISIDPPRQFRHAVAEVRILIEPFPTATSSPSQAVSIVNLLPSQKTYNVAKITSKQHAFGGAAVIEQVASVGVSAGKAKDRLYLAKDTDTVALQYDHPSVKPLRSPFPDQALTGLEAAVRMQRLDECDNDWFAIDDPGLRGQLDSNTSRNNSVLFGWQFRPVLGADYVSGGPRQVFAQLALPEALGDRKFVPAVLVQTRWREYDEKRQVVGPVFHSSCTVTPIKDPVILEDPLRVHDTTWEDIGKGVLKIRAHGAFFSPAISMQNGNKTYSPVTFDGHEIEFFAPAKDILLNGEIDLLQNNSTGASLTIPSTDQKQCKLDSTSLWAIPQGDGTARVTMILNPGKKFEQEEIRPRPLVLIGSNVYGLKETPFQSPTFCDGKDVCLYHFTAPADDLRAAGNYYVRDISWSNANLPGAIRFTPFLSKLASYSEPPAGKKTANPPVTYMVSGSDLKSLSEEGLASLKVYSMDSAQGMSPSKLSVLSDSEALLTLPCTPKGKTITVAWTPTHWPLSKEAPIAWDLTLPGQESTPNIAPAPSFLYAGDSRTLTYSGADFSTVRGVKFENSTLAFKLSPDSPTSMDVVIPSSVTKEAGHKELLAITKDKKGKAGQIVLPIEIFKR